ncbi:MAG TPA: hypothetical protein VF173_31925 [Thermoanaerobaculia bacterium]|nr:hypothetical protein [Thermoanaerobaculia bacterium]
MSSATLTVDIVNGNLTIAASNVIPANSVTASGAQVTLTPQTSSSKDTTFALSFVAGSDIVLNSMVVPVSGFAANILPAVNNGIDMTCYVVEPYIHMTFSMTINYTAQGIIFAHDPTIVFNPPAGTGGVEIANVQTAGAPLLAEAVMA